MTWTGPTDPRAERHAPPAPARPGTSADLTGSAGVGPRRVAVIGGGIAGLAASTALAERGIQVCLLDKEQYLGGRVGAWPHRLPDGTPATMSRGFHAFFRQYYNLRSLLARTDSALDRLTPVDDYPLIDTAHRTDTFRGLPRRPPWNAIAFALRSPTFTVRDFVGLNPRAALPLATVRVPDVYHRLDTTTAAELLDAINFPAAARHLAFEVFSRSFFAAPDDLSAAELAVMFHLYFLGSSEGLLFDVPTDTFDAALWEPLRHYLSRLGADVRTGTPVSAVEPGGDRRYRVHLDGDAVDVDAVVIAADVQGLQQLVRSSPGLGTADWRDQVAALRTAPPFLVHRLWLDQPVAPERPAFLGTGGWGRLDNISVLNRYENQARQWAATSGGSVVELHAYAAATGTAAGSSAEVPAIARELEDQLHVIYPETKAAGVVDAVSLWRDDCPLFAPGSFADRPTVATPDPGVVLAGDTIRIDLPVALMERAATTGLHAANLLLAGFGVTGHTLMTVPNRGRLRGLSRFKSEEDS
ncbi:isorenieratene synthase [Kribbella sp. ALI-6-A]|uniref:hydroxysqualene dehydroxylase n=1 Tax=Kribbella sp. ALI-6-A TaxID=1933817 RepID=UPI00097BD537|nr:FAD-dependent oxidoreductase [Kribbella sp. ALI-6-A]ONI66814.1 isorenieratene synthase [Kribbella sp. ALI-6-A]